MIRLPHVAITIACATSNAVCDTFIVSQDGTGDFVTIGAALDAASEGDAIFVTAGTYFEDNLMITGEITLEGEMDDQQRPAVTINGQGSPMLQFRPSINSAMVRNFVLTGSDETANSCFHSKPTLVNCTFIDNGGDDPADFSFGGAFYNLNGAPVFIDCRFIGNRGGQGGAFSTWESGPDPKNHPLFVRCIFRDNIGLSGGAMANLRSNPTLIDCIFENNTALMSGGAIYNDGFDGPDFWISRPVLEGCSFHGNQATVDGGAIFNEGSSESTITRCLFTGNSAANGGAIMNKGASFSSLSMSTACANLPNQIDGTWNDLGGNSISTECAEPCPGDFNGDGAVNGADLSALLGDWNQSGSPVDIDGDGFVDGLDLAILLGAWGPCP